MVGLGVRVRLGLVRDHRGSVGDDEGRGEDDDRCVDGRVALGEIVGVGFQAEEARGRAQERRRPAHEQQQQALDHAVDGGLRGVGAEQYECLLTRLAEARAVEGDEDVACREYEW